MKKLCVIIIAISLLLATGCGQTSNKAYTNDEICQILADTLEKAERANQELLAAQGKAALDASFFQWQRQPVEIITNKPNQLTVTLPGEFILTGTPATLPLTLTKQNGQWQIDESFRPQEQQPENYYYNQAELQNIINDLLKRAHQADLLYQAENFRQIDDSGEDFFRLIAKNQQTDREYQELAQEIDYISDVYQFFYNAFTPETAARYFEAINMQYQELPEGLAVNYNISAMPINNYDCRNDDYQVWLNTQDKIVVLMHFVNRGYEQDKYRPLNLYLIDGLWLTDHSYEVEKTIGTFPALLPLNDQDMRLPFAEQISPQQFVQKYGEPQTIENEEFLDNTECLSYNYDDFSISWIHWLNDDRYTFHSFATHTEQFWPELRNIRRGDTQQSVIKRFHHCKQYEQIDPIYGVPLIYGQYEHMRDYGLIDGDKLIYAAGDKVLRLTFADNKLTSLEWQLVDY